MTATPPEECLLSPKLRVAALKRRRLRLTGTDDLSKSAQDFLNALHDNSEISLMKTDSLKPLPAIEVNGRPTKPRPTISRENTVTLTNNPRHCGFLDKAECNEGNKRTRDYDATFILTNESGTVCDDIVKSNSLRKTTQRRRSERHKLEEYNVATSSIGTNETNSKNTITPILPKPKEKEPLSSDYNPARNSKSKQASENKISTPTRRQRRRNRNPPTVVTPIRNLSIEDNSTLSVPRSTNKSKLNKQTEKAETLSDLNVKNGLAFSCMDDSPAKCNETNIRRSRRNRHNTSSSLSDCCITDGLSDAMSMLSDDQEAYQPTLRSKDKEEKTRKHFSNQTLSTSTADESCDSRLGIFTSPRRHKKRARPRPVNASENAELLKTPLNNCNSSPGVVLEPIVLASNELFSREEMEGLNDNRQTRRKTYNKYLPPLSESYNRK
ncbi:uncharacterized protein LOC108949332 [Ciona intestinalis]